MSATSLRVWDAFSQARYHMTYRKKNFVFRVPKQGTTASTDVIMILYDRKKVVGFLPR